MNIIKIIPKNIEESKIIYNIIVNMNINPFLTFIQFVIPVAMTGWVGGNASSESKISRPDDDETQKSLMERIFF